MCYFCQTNSGLSSPTKCILLNCPLERVTVFLSAMSIKVGEWRLLKYENLTKY